MNTSNTAHAKVKPLVPSIKSRVYDYVSSTVYHGATREEIVFAVNEPDENVQPRLSELVAEGKIKASGVTRKNTRDNPEQVYVKGDGVPLPKPRKFDLIAHIKRANEFSAKTFGPFQGQGNNAAGVIDHLRKEINEIEASPADLEEWVDVIILAIDGASRQGYTPEQIVDTLENKQTKNEFRSWPDWRTATPGKAIEHIRTEGV